MYIFTFDVLFYYMYIIYIIFSISEIDIEKCVKDSLSYSQCTPRSVTYRQNEVVDKNDKALYEGLVCM